MEPQAQGLRPDRPGPWVLVPGLGLVVREVNTCGRLRVFVTPDALAMLVAMSVARVALVSVARGGIMMARRP